jgi:hypothetical protein
MKHRKTPHGGFAMGIHRPGSDLVLIVEEHIDDASQYCARWPDGDAAISYVPAEMLDLIPLMCARRLLMSGHDPDRMLVVRLAGADYEFFRASLGCAAATPLTNDVPITEPASEIYRSPHYHR